MAIEVDLIDPAAQYRVALNQKIVIDAQTTLWPGRDIELLGALVVEHAEVIDRADAV